MAREIWLVRHGETEWSLSGAHTGRTEIPLTAAGRERATALAAKLAGQPFDLVLSSPLGRARETCRLAGFADRAIIEPDLREWDYGDYEGKTTADIRREVPGWSVWSRPLPNGETLAAVAARATRVIDRVASVDTALLFAHGHIFRILAAVWLELEPRDGRLFALSTGSISILGHERNSRVIERWNQS